MSGMRNLFAMLLGYAKGAIDCILTGYKQR